MILYKKANAIKNELKKLQLKGSTIGFVPTMGALHQGHISLIDESKKQTDKTVCSIFINPTQFNDSNDFEKYPITIEQDILLLEKAGCDILFLPDVEEMYPQGIALQTKYNVGDLENILEGKYRPGHFQGVCQVVHQLLKIIEPDKLFMGQKDFQQCMVIKKLIELLKYDEKTQLVICPIVREKNGLAMSSRNMRLSNTAKEKAAIIYKSLLFIKSNYTTTNQQFLVDETIEQLLNAAFEKVDYITIVNAETLEPINLHNSHEKKVALIAAFIEGVRLIDNIVFK